MKAKLTPLVSIWLLFSLPLQAQITIEDAYPVDSLLAHTYLKAVVLHSENINATLEEPVMTWDAVNGRFDGTTIAYSFTGIVDADVAEAINEVNGQAYALFDLDSIEDLNHYRDTLEHWLTGLGLPVHIPDISTHQIAVYPNPTYSMINVSMESKNFEEGFFIKIIDQQGRVVKNIERASIHGDLLIDLSHHPNGVYILKATGHNVTFQKKVIKTAR